MTEGYLDLQSFCLLEGLTQVNRWSPSLEEHDEDASLHHRDHAAVAKSLILLSAPSTNSLAEFAKLSYSIPYTHNDGFGSQTKEL
jgi:hypothetical protein